MSARSYLSIGDVLTLLRQEFPDVTISKIRFLESQGLVNPERTPSGYRKFYEHDVERLRWVLRQQREHFLPLKVIKDRLDDDANGSPPQRSDAPMSGSVGGRAAASEGSPVAAGRHQTAEPVLVGHRSAPSAGTGRGRPPGDEQAPLGADESSTLPGLDPTDPAGPLADPPTASPLGGSRPTAGPSPGPTAPPAGPGPTARDPGPRNAPDETPAGPPRGGGQAPSSPDAPAAPPPPPASKAGSTGPPAGPGRSDVPSSSGPAGSPTGPGPNPGGRRNPAGSTGPPEWIAPPSGAAPVDISGVNLSIEELSAACGLEVPVLVELHEYGLLAPENVAGVEYFGDGALTIANLAAQFARFGIEPRHLRLYKNAADREAGFVEQIVIPLVRQRNPDARARAHDTADELARLGQQLRGALLRSALGNLLNG